MKKCSVVDCDMQHLARGLCAKHYQAAKKKNNLPQKEGIETRLKRRSVPNSETGCIEWAGYKNHAGYGRLRNGGGLLVYAHRLAWEIANGPVVNEDLRVLHRCDNPSCINPEHLFLGTQIDNIADMVAKNRQHHPKGECNGYAKLTADRIRQIRADSRILREIAIEHGVTCTAISSIKLRKSWSHVS